MEEEHMKPSAVVVDIDGVLCDNVPRQEAWIRDQGAPVGRADLLWEQFNEGLGDDPCFDEWVTLTRLIHPSVRVILLTCRSERWRQVTADWLHQHKVWYHELRMWDEDQHDYYEHKRAAIADIASEHEVQLVIEDSARHCEMFRQAGYRVIQVPGGLASDAHAAAT